MKHSIKRVQSQAGLSFAEREDVRPKVKQKLLFLLVLLMTATTGAMAQDYYAPSTDEVIILNDVYEDDLEESGFSSHSAIAWGGSASTSNKKAGDPNKGGQPTSSTVSCYTVKGTGQGKNITLSITGVSKVIVYYHGEPARYIELRDGSKTGNIIGSGEKNTYYTEVDLTATNKYSIFLHGTTNGSDDADFYVYAIKLIAAAAPATYSVTLAEGTEDADKWSVKAGEGEAQKLPLEGLEGGEKITATYSGTRKVKSVKAVKKAAGKTVDLSTYSGDSYEVTEDVTFTGTTNNAISILYKGEGYEVTLDNVNAPKCFIAAKDDYYNINVKLKGTSRLMGIYTQNAYIIIGEAEAGGTVILVDEDIPLGSPGTTITINGGTVKAKSSSYSALDSSLEVNGGAVYLEAGEDNVASASASGSVTLYGWNGSAWETYSDHRYLSTDNSKAPSEWTW